MRTQQLTAFLRPFGNFPFRQYQRFGPKKLGSAGGRGDAAAMQGRAAPRLALPPAGRTAAPAPRTGAGRPAPDTAISSGRQGPQARSRAARRPERWRSSSSPRSSVEAAPPAPAPPRSPSSASRARARWRGGVGDARRRQARLGQRGHERADAASGQSAASLFIGSSSQSWPRCVEIGAQIRAAEAQQRPRHAQVRQSPAAERAPAPAWPTARPARCRAPAAAGRSRPGRPRCGRHTGWRCRAASASAPISR